MGGDIIHTILALGLSYLVVTRVNDQNHVNQINLHAIISLLLVF